MAEGSLRAGRRMKPQKKILVEQIDLEPKDRSYCVDFSKEIRKFTDQGPKKLKAARTEIGLGPGKGKGIS
jgi:hypothetical protein